MGNAIIRKCINSLYLFSMKQLTSRIWESSSLLKCVHFISWECLTFLSEWTELLFPTETRVEIQMDILRYVIWDLENPKICLQKIPKESLDFCVLCKLFCTEYLCGHIPDSTIRRLLYDFLLIFMVPRRR